MTKRKRSRYTAEFKEQALELASEQGFSQASRGLGVSLSTLHAWRAGMRKKAEEKPLEKTSVETSEALREEIKQLRKELEEQKKVNIILKKAAAFFSQDHLK